MKRKAQVRQQLIIRTVETQSLDGSDGELDQSDILHFCLWQIHHIDRHLLKPNPIIPVKLGRATKTIPISVTGGMASESH